MRYSHFALGLGILLIVGTFLLPWPRTVTPSVGWTILGLLLDILGASTLVAGEIVAWTAVRGGCLAPNRVLGERVAKEELPERIFGLGLLLFGFLFQAIGQIRAN